MLYINNVYSFVGIIRIVTLQGRLKTNHKQVSELHFDFPIESVGKYPQSWAAAHIINLYYHSLNSA